jgi:hypothetical protein
MSSSRLVPQTKLLHFWFHTGMIRDNTLRITKEELDGAPRADKKCKTFPADFAIELMFEPCPDAVASAGIAASAPAVAAAAAAAPTVASVSA